MDESDTAAYIEHRQLIRNQSVTKFRNENSQNTIIRNGNRWTVFHLTFECRFRDELGAERSKVNTAGDT